MKSGPSGIGANDSPFLESLQENPGEELKARAMLYPIDL